MRVTLVFIAALGVGEAHGDGMRNIEGTLLPMIWGNYGEVGTYGPFVISKNATSGFTTGTGSIVGGNILSFQTKRVAPTAPQNQPRAYGVLPCVFLGPKKTQGNTP